MFTDDVLPHVLVITGPSALKYSSMTAALNAKGGNRVGSYNTFYSQVSHFQEAVVDALRLYRRASRQRCPAPLLEQERPPPHGAMEIRS